MSNQKTPQWLIVVLLAGIGGVLYYMFASVKKATSSALVKTAGAALSLIPGVTSQQAGTLANLLGGNSTTSAAKAAAAAPVVAAGADTSSLFLSDPTGASVNPNASTISADPTLSQDQLAAVASPSLDTSSVDVDDTSGDFLYD